MADWDGLRHDLERDVTPPPFAELREKRHRRQLRRTIATTFALVLVGAASGVAVIGQTGRHGKPDTTAAPTVATRFALGDQLPAKYVYENYVVTDVDFVSPDTGWAIGLRCADERCDVQTWRTDDGGRSWHTGVAVASNVPRASYSEQDPTGGGVRSLRMVDASEGFAFNPDLYVTHDGAKTWTRVPQRSKVASLSVVGTSVWAFERGCPADDDCDAVLRTGTLGAGFALRTATVPSTHALPTVVRRADESHAYLLSHDSPTATLRRTADGGRTWTAATHPCPSAVGTALSAARDRPLWVVCTMAVDDVQKTSLKKAYQSTDGGTTWRGLADLPGIGTLTDLVSVSATTAYATIQDPARLLVTNDAGTTWRIAPGTTTKAFGYGNLDAADSTHVWAMGDAGILWRTTDGNGWERLALPPGGPRATGTPRAVPKIDLGVEFTGLSFLDANRGWAVGHRCVAKTCRAVLRRTDDGGRSWQSANAPTASWQSDDGSPGNEIEDVTFADARNGWLYGSGLWSTHDGGLHWRDIAPGYVRDVVARGGYLWVVGYEGCTGNPCYGHIYRGAAGNDHLVPVSKSFEFGHVSFVAADATHAYIVDDGLVADGAPRFAVTADGGRTWITRTMPCKSATSRSLSAWAVDRLWVLCGPSVARSDDGGRTWHTTTSTGSGRGSVDALSATTGWRVDGSATALRVTRDGGRTWTAAPIGEDGVRSLAFVSPTDGWAIVASGALFRTTDGEHWEPLARP